MVMFTGYLVDGMMASGAGDDDAPNTSSDGYNPTARAENSGFLLGSTAQFAGSTVVGDNDEGMAQSSDDPIAPDANSTLAGGDSADILFGHGAADLVIGGAGDDILGGRAGDDTLFGDFGEDYLTGDEGNDYIDGGEGADTALGADGSDTLLGGAGNDVLYAGAGEDTVAGDTGNDSLFGGEGDDTITGGAGDDALDGGLGNDSLSGGAGVDEVFGDLGDDTLWGNAEGEADSEVDFLNGGAGNDVLMLGAGDWGHGDAGADSFVVTGFAMGDSPIQITDFNAEDDQLVVLYDSSLTTPPEVSLQQDASGNTQILLDGEIAVTLGARAVIDLQDIILRPN